MSASFFLSLVGHTLKTINEVRGKRFVVKLPCGHSVTVVVTYHPAAALRNPKLRDQLFEDLRMVFSRGTKSRGLDEWLQ